MIFCRCNTPAYSTIDKEAAMHLFFVRKQLFLGLGGHLGGQLGWTNFGVWVDKLPRNHVLKRGGIGEIFVKKAVFLV